MGMLQFAAVRREERAQDQIMNTNNLLLSQVAVASGVSEALGPVAGHTKAACALPCSIPARVDTSESLKSLCCEYMYKFSQLYM